MKRVRQRKPIADADDDGEIIAAPKPDLGRPTEFYPAMIEIARERVGAGDTMDELAEHLGCSKSSIYRWAQQHPAFWDAIKEPGNKADHRVEQSLYTRAMAGSDTAAIFWLKNRQRHRWQDVHKIEAEVEATVEVIPERGLAMAVLTLLQKAALDGSAAPMIEHDGD